MGNLAKWWRLFSCYKIPAYAAFDNDAEEDKDSKKRSDLLSALQVTAEAQKALLQTTELRIEPHVAVFGKNFEVCMRAIGGKQYELLEREAQQKFRLSLERSKPLIARHVAEKLPIEKDSEIEKALKKLVAAISASK